MRIVAGKFKGVILNTFQLDDVRPTPDKVREAVFSKIQFDIQGSNWLDLFGGTGAVGLEALSRGANSVVVADSSDDSAKLIISNYAKCKIRPDLYRLNFIKTIERVSGLNKQFDYIYLDPPFASNYAEKAIKLIKNYNLLSPTGVIIWEHLRSKDVSSFQEYYKIIDQKYYGTIAVTFLGLWE